MPVPEKRSFNQAYADARKNQQLEFEWNGKMYNTRSKEEGHELWLTKMYRTPYFPTTDDHLHNFIVNLKLNSLNRFTPTNERGFSAKYDYLSEINQNLSPENQLTIGDLDDWDPYGFKTSNWATLGSLPVFRPDLSMLNTNQIHNWIATSTNKMHPDNPHQLTTDHVAQWDPDGSKSKAIIFGENPEGLQNLYGKDWLHYKLASTLNDRLKANNPEFSKLFQYDPSSFSSYDPDGSIAAKYLMYGQPMPHDGSAIWDKALEAELNRWEQRFYAARNYPTREEFKSKIPDPWDNDDSVTKSIDILKSSANSRGRNWQYYINKDPLAKKYQQLTGLDPMQMLNQEVEDGIDLSVSVPLTMLGAIYGGSALFKGLSKLDRFVTRKILKAGSKFLNYSKAPKLVNWISRYGILNGIADTAFLGSAIHNYATNPNASWTDVAWGVAPFALMTPSVRKGLSWIRNAVSKGWKNPYIKSAVLTGAGIGTGIGINNLYQHTIKPAMNNRQQMFNTMQNNYLKPVQSNSSPLTKQYLSMPKTTELPELKFKLNENINSNK